MVGAHTPSVTKGCQLWMRPWTGKECRSSRICRGSGPVSMECANSEMQPQEPCGVCPRNPYFFSQNCSWAGPWAEPSIDGGTTLLLGHLAGLACDRSRSQISIAITKSLLYCSATWTFPSPQRGAVQRPRIQEKENSSPKYLSIADKTATLEGKRSPVESPPPSCLWLTLIPCELKLTKLVPGIAFISATLAAWFTHSSCQQWNDGELAASPLSQ